MTENVLIGRQGRVLTITLNRPAKLNALTQEMYGAMAAGIQKAHDDAEVRAVMLTGEGDVFTAGNDLADFASGTSDGKPPVFSFLEGIRDASKPILVAVNGPAIGIGLTMLLHCDLCYASETATFRAPFAQIGLVPEAASSLLLPQSLGNAWANDILIAGRELSAQEALDVGLISRIFPKDALQEECLKIAGNVASLAPNAVQKTKKLIRSQGKSVADQMMNEAVLFGEQLKSAEVKEAITAFREGRAPDFG